MQATSFEQASSTQTFLAKLLAKAVQSELVAAEHYRHLATLVEEPARARRFLLDAEEEEQHAKALVRAARRDACAIPAVTTDSDFDGVRAAFASAADDKDLTACLFIQDVFLELVAIALYELLITTSKQRGAFAVAALIEKKIVPDERRNLAAGLRELVRMLPNRAERTAAFRRAASALAPAMLVFAAVPADASCSKTCATCAGQCLKLDAKRGGLDLAGGWARLVAQIEGAARRIGVCEPFAA